jgi:NTP pyrophosphatase (non-canonical NTP hydrolase)
MANLSMKIKDDKHLALKHLAVDENTSVTALVEEAIELLFAMRGGKQTKSKKEKV